MIWLELAWRDLLRNRRRSLFVFCTLFVSVVATLTVFGYIITAFEGIREGTIRGGTAHFQIAHAAEFDGYKEKPLEFGLRNEEVDHITKEANNQEEVELVLPRLSFEGMISSGERSQIALGEGIDARQERRLSNNVLRITSGQGLSDFSQGDLARAMLGDELARLLRVSAGDTVTLLALTTEGGLNAIDLKVAGTFSSGTPSIDRMRIYVPYKLAQDLLVTDRISRIAVTVEKTSMTDGVANRLKQNLRGFKILTWEELTPFYGQLKDLYQKQFTIFSGILALIIVLSVVNAILMSVFERTREVGTMISLGIPRRCVRLIFVLEGALLGLIASVAGGVFSLLFMWSINVLEIQMVPPPGQTQGYPLFLSFDFNAMLIVLLFVSLAAAGSAFIASTKVAKLKVVEALRHV